VGEKLRKTLIRVLLVVGTTVSIIGYNFTRNPIFVPLPFLSGIALAVLILRAPTITPEEVKDRIRVRRNGLIQLVISFLMLAVFIIVASVRHWGASCVTGFSIMEATIGLLAVMAFITYRRAHIRVRSMHERGD